MATLYIGSVSPIPLKLDRPLYGAVYHIPAVKRDEAPFVLKVEDRIQYGRQPITQAETQTHVPAEEIAPCLLHEVNEGAPGMNADADMGLWIIGTTPDYTPEQAEAARTRLKNFLHFKVMDTDSWTPERRAKFIPPLCKLAVEHLGYDRDWANLSPNAKTLCPYCTKSVKATAIKCEHCSEVINFEAYAELEAKKQKALTKTTPVGTMPPPAPLNPTQPKQVAR